MNFTRKELFFSLSVTPLLLTGSQCAMAQGLDSHVHGEAELNVVVADQQLQAEFISPAMNLLGFERAPSSDEETELLNSVITKLLTDGSWLIGDALANCETSTLAFEGPEFEDASHNHDHEHEDDHDHEHEDDHEHDDDHDHDHEGEEAHGHADFRVQYLYDCAESPAQDIRLAAFDNYSGIEEIKVQWIVGRQQGFAELTANNPTLNLE